MTQAHWEMLQKSDFLKRLRLALVMKHPSLALTMFGTLLLQTQFRAAAASVLMNREVGQRIFLFV